jgi:site-specific DNA recombinase
MQNKIPLRAGIYTRVSSDKTGERAAVERQEQDCQKLAKRLGWDVVAVYSDPDVSAYSGKLRVDYRRMLDDIRGGRIDGIIAWHPDRLHRRAAELEGFISVAESHDLQIQTVQAGNYDLSTPAGRMVARMLGAAAQNEVENIRARVKRKKEQMAEEGKFRGGPRPFGFEPDGKTVRESEAQVIRELADAVLAGRSLNSLSRELNERGIKPATMKRKDAREPKKYGDGLPMFWRYGSVRDLLIRPRNAGILAHGLPGNKGPDLVEVKKDAYPAILSEDKYRAIVAILTDSSRRTNVTNERAHLGSGLYHCGVCGAPLRASRHTGEHSRGGTSNPRRSMRPLYRCGVSPHLTISEEETDAYVLETVAAMIRDPRVIAAMAPETADLSEQRRQRSEILASLARFDADYYNDVMTADKYAKFTAKKKAELAKVDGRMTVSLRRSASSDVLKAIDPGAAFLVADLDTQRAVIGSVVGVVIRSAKNTYNEGWKGRVWTDARVIITDMRRLNPSTD